MLRGRHCSYVTVHRNETHLYFNDLSEDAERPGRHAPYTEQKGSKVLQPDAGARRARVRVSSFWWSKPPDRTASELLVRLAPVRFRAAARPTLDRCSLAAASTSFRQGDEFSSSKRLCPAAAARATTRRRASLSCFRCESRVSRRERRTRRRSDAKLSNSTRFLAMIAIENI
jgi:hypothetical protein